MKIVVVTHDTTMTGAPKFAVQVANFLSLKKHTVTLVTRMSGELENHEIFKKKLYDYINVSSHQDLPGYSYDTGVNKAKKSLAKIKPDFVFVNSYASFDWLQAAHELEIPHLLYVHEMGGVIDAFRSLKNSPVPKESVDWTPDMTFFVSEDSYKSTVNKVFRNDIQHIIVPPGVDVSDIERKIIKDEKTPINVKGLSLRYDSPIVVSCGDPSHRKGFDIFIDVASQNPSLQFLWVGNINWDNQIHIQKSCKEDIPHNLFLTGVTNNPYFYLSKSSLFILTSREDPMPLVVMEAAAVGLDVVNFRSSGGSHIITEECGYCILGKPNEEILNDFIRSYNFSDKRKNTSAQKLIKDNYDIKLSLDKIETYITSAVNKPKVLTFYLPAFYPFTENNKFWGKGFTEWTNIQKWEPFYEGHKLKTESLELGQYDPRDIEVRRYHGKTAKEAGIYGFVFYHYWFSKHPGKKVMHDVLEKMLEDGEPNIPFCFEWANEPWTKKWDGQERDYLIRQEYGDEEDHREHFEYLDRFFSHKNYIKVDNMPVLCIYRIGHIDNFLKLKRSYNKLAIEKGYDGIYFIELLNSFEDKGGKFNPNADAYAEYHPMYINLLLDKNNNHKSLSQANPRTDVKDAPTKWKEIVNIKPPLDKIGEKPYYRGMYVGWDSTPRALGRRGLVDENNTPEEFSYYLSKQVNNVINDKFNPHNFLFLFAWNEWGEGAVLEPDNVHKYSYINAVKKSLRHE